MTFEPDEAELVGALLVVSVNQSYPGRNAYDAARYAWPVSRERAAQIEHVLAAKDGVIVGVFRPTEWRSATRENFPEFDMHLPKRRAFSGVEADEEMKRRYLGRRMPAGFRFAGTGIRYAGTLGDATSWKAGATLPRGR